VHRLTKKAVARAVFFFNCRFTKLCDWFKNRVTFSTNQKVTFKPIISSSYTFPALCAGYIMSLLRDLIGSLDCLLSFVIGGVISFMYLFERMKQQILSLGICLNLLEQERQVQLQITSSDFTWAKKTHTITYDFKYSIDKNRLLLSSVHPSVCAGVSQTMLT